MKILHIAFDEKFVDMAIQAFEAVALHSNELCMYLKDVPRHVQTKPNLVLTRTAALRGLPKTYFEKYQIVIVHSLHPAFYRSLLNIPVHIPVVWIGWGYDYYDIIANDEKDLLLQETYARCNELNLRRPLSKIFINYLYKKIVPRKVDILRRINFFAPVLPGEFVVIKQNLKKNFNAKYIKWNYGTLEDNLLPGIENAFVNGNSILVGNSAAYTNNHAEVFSFLARLNLKQNVIVPLSYGDGENRDQLIIEGSHLFGERFRPIVEFMPIKDYNLLLQSCGYVVMNHVRQQALGNIISMLYLGARIFLRKECETYRFLTAEGAFINSIQELEANPALLNMPLDIGEREKNREVIYRHWSKYASWFNTRNLIDTVVGFHLND